jgi:hypothetical protein
VFKALCYSRKVPGSIPGGVNGDFSVASDNSTCPGSTLSLKMSTRILLGVKTADAYGHLQVSMSRNLEALTNQHPLGPISLSLECFIFTVYRLHV